MGAQIRDNLLEFVHLDPTAPGFIPSLEKLMKTLKQHIKDVERQVLVAIEKALDGEESERMASDWERTGKFMPGDGWNPPFETIDGLLGASYEELKGAWEKLPRD